MKCSFFKNLNQYNDTYILHIKQSNVDVDSQKLFVSESFPSRLTKPPAHLTFRQKIRPGFFYLGSWQNLSNNLVLSKESFHKDLVLSKELAKSSQQIWESKYLLFCFSHLLSLDDWFCFDKRFNWISFTFKDLVISPVSVGRIAEWQRFSSREDFWGWRRLKRLSKGSKTRLSPCAREICKIFIIGFHQWSCLSAIVDFLFEKEWSFTSSNKCS